jgi:hypothetical protein
MGRKPEPTELAPAPQLDEGAQQGEAERRGSAA